MIARSGQWVTHSAFLKVPCTACLPNPRWLAHRPTVMLLDTAARSWRCITSSETRWESEAVPMSACCSIWLYSLVPADYGGASVLPHWVRHYQGLGIRPANLLLLVNHNPEK